MAASPFVGLAAQTLETGKTMYRELKAMGVNDEIARCIAANNRRWWHNSRYLLNFVMPIAFFDQQDMHRLL